MRKLLFLVLAFTAMSVVCLFWAGCTGKTSEQADSLVVDTLVKDTDSIQVDTTPANPFEEIIAATPMPKAADELFDDFIFNFMANRRVQLERIQFPLTVETDGETHEVARNEWEQERFWHNDIYTLILDNLSQLEASKDTAVNHVVVEKFHIEEDRAQQFEFNRIEGQWKMTSLHESDFDGNRNASFLKFYQQFVTDSLFQSESIAENVRYSGPHPEDEMTHMTGRLPKEVWEMFAPDLPRGTVYNIIYGEEGKSSDQKILDIRVPASSIGAQLMFKQENGVWLLTKLTL